MNSFAILNVVWRPLYISVSRTTFLFIYEAADLFHRCTKEQLVEIADHFSVVVSKQLSLNVSYGLLCQMLKFSHLKRVLLKNRL